MEKKSLSFSFAKTKEAKQLKASAISENEKNIDQTPEYLTSLVGNTIQSTQKKEKKKELVIPLIEKNRWKNPKRPEELDTEDDEEPEVKKRRKDQSFFDEKKGVEKAALEEILKEAALEGERWDGRGDDARPQSERTVPLLMQNAVPGGFETEDKLDVQLRPDEPEEANYTEIPIEEYGMAMLRGMGFQMDKGIGKNGKVFKPIEAVARPKGLGLGADRSKTLQAKPQGPRKPGDPKQEELVMKKGAYVIVQSGANRELYGEVVGLDEDNNRAMVKMALGSETVSLSQNAVQLVTKEDYFKYSKYINKSKADRYKEEIARKEEKESSSRDPKHKKHRKHRHEHSDHDSDRDSHKKHKKSKHSRSDKDKRENGQAESTSRRELRPEDVWLRAHLRVRVIDPDLKHGKYYKTKVVIEDVISHNKCVVKTEDGKLVEGLSQSQLETVIPRSDPAYVMILSGKHKNAIAELLRKDKSACIATVQLLSDRGTVLETHYDTICEYLGDVTSQADF